MQSTVKTFITIALTLCLLYSAIAEELFYDTQQCNIPGLPGNEIGGEIAVRFTPSSYPVKIKSIKFYVNTWYTPDTTFGVKIYSADNGHPGILLNDPITASAATGNEWVEVDVSAENIVVTSGDFFAAMVWLTAPGPDYNLAQSTCIDTSVPISQRTYWKWPDGSWTTFISGQYGYGDATIRAIVDATDVPIPVKAAFTISTASEIVPVDAAFTAQASGSFNVWTWDFGDGETLSGTGSPITNPLHTYTQAGSYTVKLTASGTGGTDTYIQNIDLFKIESPQINMESNPVKLSNEESTLQWFPVAGADHYIFEYALHADFSNPIRINQLNATQYNFSFPLPLKDGHYFWRVQSVDADQNTSKWAESAFYYEKSIVDDSLYTFKYLWPTSKNNQFFDHPTAIAVSDRGYVYITDTNNHRVQKLNKEGYLITSWGLEGSDPGNFKNPLGIAVDSLGNVYVADSLNFRIQKFDANGKFLNQWGKKGSGPGQFDWLNSQLNIGIIGMACDPMDNLYVLDPGQKRLTVFSSDGGFLKQVNHYTGLTGSEQAFDSPSDIAVHPDGRIFVLDRIKGVQIFSPLCENLLAIWGNVIPNNNTMGRLSSPQSIAIDKQGYVYITDPGKNHIFQFNDFGALMYEIGWEFGAGACPSTFRLPFGIAADREGFFYVADRGNNRIQKFYSLDGSFSSDWGNYGREPGELLHPGGISMGSNQEIFIADTYNHRVQKFTKDGQYLKHLGGLSCTNDLCLPSDLTLHSNGVIYVADTYANRVSMLSQDLEPLGTWGWQGSGQGQFNFPTGIVSDSNGYVYVADTGNHRIQKFSPDGTFVTQWGNRGSGQSQFIWSEFTDGRVFENDWEVDFVIGMAVDIFNNIYVVDRGNHRIQKFFPDGTFIEQFGTKGSAQGQFEYPSGIAIDHKGDIYVTDTGNHRIQVFSPSWAFISQWGQKGLQPGQVSMPTDIVTTTDGDVFFTDSGGNNRIQVFKRMIPSKGKAIIVAGGGPDFFGYGNALWPTTQICANFAYRALNYRGYSKQNLHYLTSDSTLDLDSNQVLDDVSGDATNDNLKQAITQWAADAENLVIYIIDHGGDGVFGMSRDNRLSATLLDEWLDSLQETMTGKITLIYDACQSGSFLEPLKGENRIILTSAQNDEEAYFLTDGAISFSQPFWSNILMGKSIHDAFTTAKNTINAWQSPLIDANGNGAANETDDQTITRNMIIGSSFQMSHEIPLIEAGSEARQISGENTADLFAVLNQGAYISRVWAMIRPPGYMNTNSKNAVLEFPSIDLVPDENTPNRYTATYDKFYLSGTYHISIYAKDKKGNISIPHITSVSVDNPLLHRRAVILAGGNANDPLWPAIEKEAKLAYTALKARQYSDEDIMFHCPTTIAGVDSISSFENLENTLTIWAADNTQDLVIYLVGKGFDQTFTINPTQALGAEQLDFWLDILQTKINGDIVFVYDACRSGSFISKLTPPKDKHRIVITGSDLNQPACFAAQGDVSFSSFFWSRIAKGGSVKDAFLSAKNALSLSEEKQKPCLDDNGNGVGNEKADGNRARYYSIGMNIITAAGEPLIGRAGIDGKELIWAENLKATGTITNVWAVIVPKDTPTAACDLNLTTITLNDMGQGRYQASTVGLDLKESETISIFATDLDGNVSMPRTLMKISSISPEQTLTGQNSATIWIQNDEATGTIDKVWAAVTPPYITLPHPDIPEPEPKIFNLVFNESTNQWEGDYNDFSSFGTYKILIYTQDTDGNISIPSATSIIQTIGPDAYEDDDTFLTANVITIDQIQAQNHNAHDAGDQDWVMFYGVKGKAYHITTENLETNCDTVITIYDHDGITQLEKLDEGGPGEKDEFTWACPSDGFFYVMIKQYESSVFGADTGYGLRIWSPTAPVGVLIGQIMDLSGNGVSKALITSDLTTGAAVSLPNGYYLSMLPAGTHNITATAPGLLTKTQTNIEISAEGVTTLNFLLNQSYNDGPGIPTSLQATPDKSIQTNDNTIEIFWTPGTNPGIGVAGYSYFWDTNATAQLDNTIETTSTFTESPALADGNTHYFHIAAVDNEGKISAVVDFGPFMIDTTPPVSVLLNTPDSIAENTDISITVAGLDIVAYKFKLNDADFNNEVDIAIPIELSGLAVGKYTLSVIGKDTAGNWQAIASATVAGWEVIPSFLKGDVNNDKAVNLKDIFPVLKNQTGGKPDPNINIDADVNGDFLIGIHEAIYILQN
ncbi:MAG: C13 family peptidase [Pseudomonadota bacterium]